ncbi:MAG: amidohydrolase family protein [Bacteroidota bacterium]|nr:amidohydrolase family protein [Bacteroidota bacterium]
MRFLTADWIFPLYRSPIKNGVLCVSEEGTILDIFNKEKKPAKTEVFKGVLFPGFINAHCHLELSHLKNFISKNTGFISFAEKIKQRNSFSKNKIQKSILEAEQCMKKNGIVGVGDICNTYDTVPQKEKGVLKYYNFIEVFGTKEEYTDAVIQKALEVQKIFSEAKLKATLTPHSRYSVTPNLMTKTVSHFNHSDTVYSIHNQETQHENNLFKEKSGEMLDWLKNMHASQNIWEEEGTNTVLSIAKKFNYQQNLLLVHNTFTTLEEITLIEECYKNIYWCTCPKSNLFIEGVLPNYSFFKNYNLCIGTDSLASNNSLSILDEIKIIASNSTLNLQQLLIAACYNGAKALGFSELGSFKKHNTPGINLMKNLNGLKLTEETEVEIIL